MPLPWSVAPPWLVVEFDVVTLGAGVGLGILLIVVLRLELVVVSYWSAVPPCGLHPMSAKAEQSIRIVFFILSLIDVCRSTFQCPIKLDAVATITTR